jgi:hypothetical protein
MDGFANDAAVEKVAELLRNPKETRDIVETNFELGKKYFSLEVLEEKINAVFNNF